MGDNIFVPIATMVLNTGFAMQCDILTLSNGNKSLVNMLNGQNVLKITLTA